LIVKLVRSFVRCSRAAGRRFFICPRKSGALMKSFLQIHAARPFVPTYPPGCLGQGSAPPCGQQNYGGGSSAACLELFITMPMLTRQQQQRRRRGSNRGNEEDVRIFLKRANQSPEPHGSRRDGWMTLRYLPKVRPAATTTTRKNSGGLSSLGVIKKLGEESSQFTVSRFWLAEKYISSCVVYSVGRTPTGPASKEIQLIFFSQKTITHSRSLSLSLSRCVSRNLTAFHFSISPKNQTHTHTLAHAHTHTYIYTERIRQEKKSIKLIWRTLHKLPFFLITLHDDSPSSRVF